MQRAQTGTTPTHVKDIPAANPQGQILAAMRAWENAGLDPATATLVEAHGTGTALGDPIEVEALAARSALQPDSASPILQVESNGTGFGARDAHNAICRVGCHYERYRMRIARAKGCRAEEIAHPRHHLWEHRNGIMHGVLIAGVQVELIMLTGEAEVLHALINRARAVEPWQLIGHAQADAPVRLLRAAAHNGISGLVVGEERRVLRCFDEGRIEHPAEEVHHAEHARVVPVLVQVAFHAAQIRTRIEIEEVLHLTDGAATRGLLIGLVQIRRVHGSDRARAGTEQDHARVAGAIKRAASFQEADRALGVLHGAKSSAPTTTEITAGMKNPARGAAPPTLSSPLGFVARGTPTRALDTRQNVRFAAGETIFNAGDEGHVMYVVQSGEVDVVVQDQVIETIAAGGIFGEMALIDRAPRSASVIARTDCRLVPLDEARFMQHVHRTPFFAIQVMRIMTERLRRRMQVAGQPASE